MIRQSVVKTWEIIGAVVGLYTVYQKLKTLGEAKQELYQQLSPELKAQWEKVFGRPSTQVVVQVPVQPEPPTPEKINI